MTGCEHVVLPAVAPELLCLNHFLEHSLARAEQALELCQLSQPLDQATLHWLLSDARHTAQALASEASRQDAAQQEKILDLLLCLSNLEEYVRHHSIKLTEHD
jgi:hypothetical protein